MPALRRAGRAALFSAVISTGAVPARAQDETALRAFFEGRRVLVTLDMPGTSDGVDVQVGASTPLDFADYGARVKANGVAIAAGTPAIVTLVKLKDDLIEFQLNGGGFGTFGDDTSTSVYVPHVEKSEREKGLERAVRDESDPRRRRDLQRELDDVRDRREAENQRIDALRADAEEHRKERVAAARLHGGSRFNLRYDDRVPARLTPQDVMVALSPYVDFRDFPGAPPVHAEPAAGGSPEGVGALRKGLLRTDVERILGRPASAAEREEGSLRVATVVFLRGGERISAEFVEDVLVRYTIASR
jgi:hypothetical protein